MLKNYYKDIRCYVGEFTFFCTDFADYFWKFDLISGTVMRWMQSHVFNETILHFEHNNN